MRNNGKERYIEFLSNLLLNKPLKQNTDTMEKRNGYCWKLVKKIANRLTII